MFGDALRYLLQGVPLGCAYALVAMGLVLTYKTSGVFNLAFGAQAFLSTVVFYELRVDAGWSIVPAALVAVVVTGTIAGLLLDRVLFRFLRGAVWQVKLITALGLLTGIPEIVKLIFGAEQPLINVPALVSQPEHVFHLGDQVIKAKELAAISATLGVIVVLVVLFRFTALGLQMRAIVESPRMVELAGLDSERIGMAAWVLSSLMAGLAGVLLAPLYGQVDSNSFTVLLVVAIAGAAVGRLTSLPLAVVGALGLGVAQQVFNGELDPSSPSELVRVLYEGLGPALPFVLLFVVLIASPALRNKREVTDPLRGVDPPPPNLAVTYHDARLRRINLVVFPTFVIAVIVSTQTWLSSLWVSRFTDGIVLAVMLLSITVITGLGGQISLAQATFAGIGGFTAAQLSFNHGFGTVEGMLAGAALAALVGALVAIPSLRLGGIYLTLATLALALAADAVVFKLDGFTGGADGIFVPEPSVFGIALDTDQRFFLFAFAVFGVVGAIVILLRKGTTGLQFAAIRGSEVAAPSVGINPTAARIKLFAVSAGIAGLGGGLFASFLGSQFGVLNESIDRYNAFFGFVLIVLVVSVSGRTVDGAVIAGMSFVLFPLLLEELSFPPELAIPAFAFGAITYARHPEGIAEFQKLRSVRDQIRHHALGARAQELRRQGALEGWRPPPLVTALGTAPALLLMVGFAISGTHLGETEVLVYLGMLTVPVVVAGLRSFTHLARLRVALGVDSPAGVEWSAHAFPLFLLALNLWLQVHRGTAHTPTNLGWGLVLGVGTIVTMGWLGRVQWIVTEHQVVLGERHGSPGTWTGEATPTDALATAPPGAG